MSLPRLVPDAATDAATVVRLRDAAAGWLLARGIDQWRPGELRSSGGDGPRSPVALFGKARKAGP